MKLLVDALADHGFYGPFRGERSCLVDRTGDIVAVIDPRQESERRRTDLAEGIARAINAQIRAERGESAAA